MHIKESGDVESLQSLKLKWRDVPHYYDDITLILGGITYGLDATFQICNSGHQLLLLVKNYCYFNLQATDTLKLQCVVKYNKQYTYICT